MKIDVSRAAHFIITPQGIVVATVMLSIAGWLIPAGEFRGFDNPEPLFSIGGVMVFLWYSMIYVLSATFFSVGKRVKMGTVYFNRYASLTDNLAYTTMTLIALVGCYYTFHFFLKNLGWQGMVAAITEHQANRFRETFDENYHKGLLSLRYCAILSAGLAIYRILIRDKFFSSWLWLDVLNIILVLTNALYSSRLSLIASLIFGFGLYVINYAEIKISIIKTACVLAAVFGLLSFYSATRTLNTYMEHGIDSQYQSGGMEIVRYLGSPFQMSLAVGNHYDLAAAGIESSRYADLDGGLYTNSVFHDFTATYGMAGWVYIAVVSIFASFIMGALSHHRRNFLILVYLGLLFCFGEIWRTFEFDKGFVIMMLGASFMVACGIGFLNATLGREGDIPDDDDDEEEDEEEDEFQEVEEEYDDITGIGNAHGDDSTSEIDSEVH